MGNLDENLSEILDIDVYQEESLVPEILDPEVGNDVSEDVEFARSNIKSLIMKGNIALNDLSKVAKESELPRAYEVLATMMKNMAEMNKDLLELQKRKKDLSPSEFKSKQNINVEKAVVFTGSTAELIKLIKQNKDE